MSPKTRVLVEKTYDATLMLVFDPKFMAFPKLFNFTPQFMAFPMDELVFHFNSILYHAHTVESNAHISIICVNFGFSV